MNRWRMEKQKVKYCCADPYVVITFHNLMLNYNFSSKTFSLSRYLRNFYSEERKQNLQLFDSQNACLCPYLPYIFYQLNSLVNHFLGNQTWIRITNSFHYIFLESVQVYKCFIQATSFTLCNSDSDSNLFFSIGIAIK